MTISDCLGRPEPSRFAHTLDATLDAPSKRADATRLLQILDLLRSDTIDHEAATYDIAA